MIRESRYPTVVDHDRKPVFIDPGLLALLDDRIQFRITVRFPFLAVEANKWVRIARMRVPGLPLRAEIRVLVVIGDLETQLGDTVLARNGCGFQRICLD